ncbi:YceD family protein [Homoserinibacter sp. YIM 151385]|uniref:YceD family protein n=1 Tax=Homoserinibacter sp. YIM 151385 TaxID=2985506 RepID=UPI0022F141A1|nr:DUF177 domain-containing protein [Homoserinibacter sp. YIM 151385]WBU39195.1 DUF177 domain-containing protein [Homoserinibacter sp. YIM 151385]
MRELELELTAPEQIGEAVAVVREGEPVRIDLRLESLHDGILVTADVRTTARGECVRCLDPVELPVRVDIQELFGYSVDEALDYQVRDDHVDLEPVVRDAVVLSLPFQPVCRPDCAGLDPETGEKLAPGTTPQQREVMDPRWAALEGFEADTTTDDPGTASAQ